MKVLVFDPGVHIGLAQFADVAPEAETFAALAITPDELFNEAEIWVLWADVVVCESFQIGGQRGHASNETIEQIGVLRYLCRKHSIEFVEQVPGKAKFGTDAKLRRLGWWTKGPGDHSRSATRHLITYLAEVDYPGFRARLLMSDPEEG